jgi:hypothetical protein
MLLGAAAVLPSIVTLRSGAQTSAASNVRCWSRNVPESEIPDRFVLVPDGWLRKKVYSGQYHSHQAFCTTWAQEACVAEGSSQGRYGRQAADGTTWAVGGDTVTIGPGVNVEHISDVANYYSLVYVDATGINHSLEPDPTGNLRPVREACWTSMIGDRGSRLG